MISDNDNDHNNKPPESPKKKINRPKRNELQSHTLKFPRKMNCPKRYELQKVSPQKKNGISRETYY